MFLPKEKTFLPKEKAFAAREKASVASGKNICGGGFRTGRREVWE